MLTRYHKGPDGKPVKKALVYTAQEHGIQVRDLDQDAVRIVKRLRDNGHDAYIVGGAVRDLLLSKRPKDYDIVTDAQPARIKKIFYRSRIIGRRFRLVHVYAGPKIYEVSTFRSIASGTIGNEYGTIDDDAKRRDFSINALYYDPVGNTIVDYVHGMKDFKAQRIVPVIPLKTIFKEDPVRMLRAIKYSVGTGFAMVLPVRMAIRKHASLLTTASTSRLGEEAMKIISGGRCLPICRELFKYKLLDAILPSFANLFRRNDEVCNKLESRLLEMDEHVHRTAEKTLSILLTFILSVPVEEAAEIPAVDTAEAYHNALQASRDFLLPVTLPRIDVEKAVRANFIAPEPKSKVRKPRKRRRRPRRSESSAGEAQNGAASDASSLDT
ncbi:MAG: polynucleotide adenylyltransferase PcnB [Spirochaetes bacterium]|nr:polynucleotide adenylyltransferase PcnB [Spirochaetota bacterium]MBU0955618.1 polynucleotide adenylyltransferase PcnB [Spirochaetota bacterium]